MRALIALLALAAASPAAAQPYLAMTRALDLQNAAQAQAAHSRDVALTNELRALQGRLGTDERLSNLAAARASPTPAIHFDPKGPPPHLEMSQMAQIPDAALAASNARAVAASQNRR